MPADLGEANAATTPSPVWLNKNPSWASIAVRNTSSWVRRAARIASASDSHRRVDPSISVNKNVTTCEGGPPSDTPAECHNAHFNAANCDELSRLSNLVSFETPEG